MATTIPQVRVTRIEAGLGFLITCSCGDRTIRPDRRAADAHAADHQRSHVAPSAARQHEGLGLR
ncbi:hypothetical protein QWY28_13395 [Nocardioides sp. SOB77]|uniref:Uncharacterized protein n=1 Tax=Nocardioides oceani TaxID=3058369 RepID=A0ABT8FHF1_9ACTN|nr:hypothetical protein [Nocardioides oceani]MDN4173950.1 hypothetical protein [Nocardioides oceani]